MKLSYSGQEKVQAPPAAVWAFVQDPKRVAQCLPDVQNIEVVGEHHLQATVQVGVGMLRGKFKFDIEVQPDQDANQVNVNVTGSGLGSHIDMLATAKVVDNGDGSTKLDWNGDIEMRGPIAKAGGRMLDTQAQKLVAKTFQNMSTNMSASSGTIA